MVAPEIGDSSLVTWLESDLSRQIEDLLCWLWKILDLTSYPWLDLDFREMTCQVIAVLVNMWIIKNVYIVLDSLPSDPPVTSCSGRAAPWLFDWTQKTIHRVQGLRCKSIWHLQHHVKCPPPFQTTQRQVRNVSNDTIPTSSSYALLRRETQTTTVPSSSMSRLNLLLPHGRVNPHYCKYQSVRFRMSE